jgi:hypothetical protein
MVLSESRSPIADFPRPHLKKDNWSVLQGDAAKYGKSTRHKASDELRFLNGLADATL